MNEPLYSIRMRASCQGQHLTGAERIVGTSAIGEVTAALMTRAVGSAGAKADEVHCSLERIEPMSVRYDRLPDISTFNVKSWSDGRLLAKALLTQAGVRDAFAEKAIQLLADGAAPGGGVMRGAVVMNAQNGERLEQDHARGIRVSRMDLEMTARAGIEQQLAHYGLSHVRVCEALVLAGKVSKAPGIVAELCWSDAPDYVTGYVSSPRNGYQRISILKQEGDPTGGRVFFVDPNVADFQVLADYLQHQPILFNALGQIAPAREWDSSDG